MEDDEELEQIRRRKLQELEDEYAQQELVQEQLEQLEAQKQMLLRKILTPEARERLATLKMARPEYSALIERQLIMMAQSGRIRGQIDDRLFKQILQKLLPKKREIRIERR